MTGVKGPVAFLNQHVGFLRRRRVASIERVNARRFSSDMETLDSLIDSPRKSITWTRTGPQSFRGSFHWHVAERPNPDEHGEDRYGLTRAAGGGLELDCETTSSPPKVIGSPSYGNPGRDALAQDRLEVLRDHVMDLTDRTVR
jgi:hypothetical protein